MRETKKVTSQRLQLVAPTLIRLHQLGEVAEVQTPGFELHWSLIEEMVVRSWIHGELTARSEIRVAQQRRLATFNDPPPLEWPGPPPGNAIEWARKRRVLLGKWNRDLDAEVTRVLVQTLETGASSQKMMQELAEVFPTFTSRRLEMIARTETTAALNQGRLARFRDPDGGVEAVQFVAILDARVTSICRARDGLILRLDDPRLLSNTPPLHINCRSTLVPVMDIDMEDLAAGDEVLQQRYFGWLEGENAPKNLDEALQLWDDVPSPAKGFGRLGETASKTISDRNNISPAPSPGGLLKDWVDKQKAQIKSPDDIRAIGRRVFVNARSVAADAAPGLETNLRRATADLAHSVRQYDKAKLAVREARKQSEEAVANARSEASRLLKEKNAAVKLRNKLEKKLKESRRDSLIDTLGSVREFGGVQQRWKKGTSTVVKDAVIEASQYLPKEWLNKARKHSTLLGTVSNRGGYSHFSRELRLSNGEGGYAGVALHEFGHRMESINSELGKSALEYLKQRTRGESAQKLSDLTGYNYRHDEKARPDRFLDPYFGKDYSEDATEMMSMGLQSIFYGVYNLWDEDPELLEFVIGALAAL